MVEYLRIKQAAHAANVSTMTIRRNIAAGRLPAVKIGKAGKTSAYMIERKAFERLMRPGG